VKQNTVHQFGIVDRSTDFLDETDVSKVNVSRLGSDEAENRVDSDRGENGRILRNDLNHVDVS